LSKEEETSLFCVIEEEERRILNIASKHEALIIEIGMAMSDLMSYEENDKKHQKAIALAIESIRARQETTKALVDTLSSRRISVVAVETAMENTENVPEWARYSIRQSIGIIQKITEKIFHCNIRLILGIVHKINRKAEYVEDLFQEGSLGMIRAIERFEVKKGFKLSTYATFWIRQYVSRAMAKMGDAVTTPHHVHDDIAAAMNVIREGLAKTGKHPSVNAIANSLDMPVDRARDLVMAMESNVVSIEDADVDIVDETNAIEAWHGVDSMKKVIYKCFENMNKTDVSILCMRFGIDIPEKLSLEEISKKIGLSSERIRQIELRALRKMAMRLNGMAIAGVEDFV
jgi:RNA polymerase sigma factor (sigma-70 family)